MHSADADFLTVSVGAKSDRPLYVRRLRGRLSNTDASAVKDSYTLTVGADSDNPCLSKEERMSKINKVTDFDDLSELCTGTAENEGVWIPVVLYGREVNLKALIYGEISDSVQKYQKDKLRKQMKRLNVKQKKGRLDFDDEGLEEVVNDDGIETALVRLGGLSKLDGSPLKFNGKDVPVTKDKESEEIYAGILRGMPELSDFIMREAKERENFLPQKKKN